MIRRAFDEPAGRRGLFESRCVPSLIRAGAFSSRARRGRERCFRPLRFADAAARAGAPRPGPGRQDAGKEAFSPYIGDVKTLALLLIALSAAPAAASETPATDGRVRFQGLFVDWSAAGRQSIEAEREAAARPPTPAVTPATAAMATAGSRELGERVGDIVALGDCAEGERVARAAGDFALVTAVRDYCNARPTEER
ncbi:MAG: hypothetical protein QOC65_517 [Sphingomonadales bacterium]|nr:hypothetical protein [Sphingomonadales bacterium]